ncbi:MAG: YfhO family protein [Lachnospiraceae bacterium]|nr:YfhO family protein [Lachnospiraceae bacterium]
MKERSNNLKIKTCFPKRFLRLYTLLFLIASFSLLVWFFAEGKTFIRNDGLSQHYKVLVYWGRYLRSLVRELVLHKRVLLFHDYSFNIGMGADLTTYLSFYGAGEPLNLFAALVPEGGMWILYEALVFVRLYLAGLAFSAYAYHMTKAGTNSLLAGCMIYLFCSFPLNGGTKHPMFLIPMIFLPLLLLGMEYLMEERRGLLFTLSVCFSAISNFYFFYMQVVLCVLYMVLVIIRRIRLKQKPVVIFRQVLRIFCHALSGLLMSCVILLPVLLLFLDSARSGSGAVLDLSTDLYHILLLFPSFFSAVGCVEWAPLNYAAPFVFVLLGLLMKKGHPCLKSAVLILTALLPVPLFHSVMNGFTYPAARWIWGYNFVIAYAVVVGWKDVFSQKKRLTLAALLVSALMLAVSIGLLPHRLWTYVCAGALILAGGGCLILSERFEGIQKKCETALLGLMLVSVCINAYLVSHDPVEHAVDTSASIAGLDRETRATAEEAVLSLGDETGFYRVSESEWTPNSALVTGVAGVDSYLSLSEKNKHEFSRFVGQSISGTHMYRDFDNKTILESLCGVRYYGAGKNRGKSYLSGYGYESRKEDLAAKYQKNLTVYENPNALPFGYTYDTVIAKETLEKEDPAVRVNTMLSSAVCDEALGALPEGKVEREEIRTFSCRILSMSEGVSQTDEGIRCSTDKGEIVLSPIWEEPVCNVETGLYIKGFSFEEGTKGTEVSVPYRAEYEDGAVVKNGTRLRNRYHKWYSGVDDFIVNFRYAGSPLKTVTITLPQKGLYRFSGLSVVCQGFDTFKERIEKRKEAALTDVDLHLPKSQKDLKITNRITGRIRCDERKLLCLALPLSKGWSAYVDGEKTSLYPANIVFSGMIIEPGTHEIELVYHTPGRLIGFLLTVAGILLYILMPKSAAIREES